MNLRPPGFKLDEETLKWVHEEARSEYLRTGRNYEVVRAMDEVIKTVKNQRWAR